MRDPSLGEGRRGIQRVRVQQIIGRGVLKGPTPGQHFIHHHANAVEITTCINVMAARLLRGDVFRRAGGGRQGRIAQIVGTDVEQRRHFRQTEVHQFERLLGCPGVQDHQVARLNVAVDDASFVSRARHIAQLHQQSAGSFGRQPAFPVQQRAEIDAAQVLHHQHGAIRIVWRRIVIANSVGMLETRQDVNFATKKLAWLGLVEKLLAQHLDHDLAPNVDLASQPDFAHAALIQ